MGPSRAYICRIETRATTFAAYTYIYATVKHECLVLCKMQRGLTAVNSWCECRSIKINERKTQAIYFSRRLRVPEDVLQLNGRNIPFVNNAKYLDVTFAKKMSWRHHIERTVAKVMCTYIQTYSLFISERLSTNTKYTSTLYKSLIMLLVTHACRSLEYAADSHLLKL
jgi:hypothetical protein